MSSEHRRCGAAGKSSLLRAQRGQCGRIPRQRATPGAGSLGPGAAPRHRAHSGPAHNRALVGGGGRCSQASDPETRVSLLALQPGAGGKTGWGRQRDASPDSGWAIFGNGSTLLHSRYLGTTTGPAPICPPKCSLKRPPTPSGKPSTPQRGWRRRRLHSDTWQATLAPRWEAAGFVPSSGKARPGSNPAWHCGQAAPRSAPKPSPWASTWPGSARGQHNGPCLTRS